MTVYQQRVEQLELEREELEQLLEQRDQQLETMKCSVASLNAEYMADLGNVRQECQELGKVTFPISLDNFCLF